METKRRIGHIVLHCTDTFEKTSVETIQEIYNSQTPYHYLITSSGEEVKLCAENIVCQAEKATRIEGIHIAYIGGKDTEGNAVNTLNNIQEDALFYLTVRLFDNYRDAEIVGHRDVDKTEKSCPRFSVKNWLKKYLPVFLNTVQ